MIGLVLYGISTSMIGNIHVLYNVLNNNYNNIIFLEQYDLSPTISIRTKSNFWFRFQHRPVFDFRTTSPIAGKCSHVKTYLHNTQYLSYKYTHSTSLPLPRRNMIRYGIAVHSMTLYHRYERMFIHSMYIMHDNIV